MNLGLELIVSLNLNDKKKLMILLYELEFNIRQSKKYRNGLTVDTTTKCQVKVTAFEVVTVSLA